MNQQNAKNIVKFNMKIAVMDAMGFNPVKADDELNSKVDKLLEDGVEKKMRNMQEDEIRTFALAIISGNEIAYDDSRDDFFISIYMDKDR